jgi:hypothetical protein
MNRYAALDRHYFRNPKFELRLNDGDTARGKPNREEVIKAEIFGKERSRRSHP